MQPMQFNAQGNEIRRLISRILLLKVISKTAEEELGVEGDSESVYVCMRQGAL